MLGSPAVTPIRHYYHSKDDDRGEEGPMTPGTMCHYQVLPFGNVYIYMCVCMCVFPRTATTMMQLENTLVLVCSDLASQNER